MAEARDRYRHVLVQPRYLAGTYDIETALHPLRGLAWPQHDDHHGAAYLLSPCRRVQIAVTPNDPAQSLWTFTAYRSPKDITALWTAVADERTPEEIVRGLVDAIAADPPTPDQDRPRVLYGTANAKHTVYAPVAQAGWRYSLSVQKGTSVWTAPDRLAALAHRRAIPLPVQDLAAARTEAWSFWGGRDGDRWRASFSAETPHHLIAGFATALADPAPVLRERLDLPRAHEPHVTVRPVPSPPLTPPTPRPPQQRTHAATSRSATTAPPSGDNIALPHQRRPPTSPPQPPPPRHR